MTTQSCHITAGFLKKIINFVEKNPGFSAGKISEQCVERIFQFEDSTIIDDPCLALEILENLSLPTDPYHGQIVTDYSSQTLEADIPLEKYPQTGRSSKSNILIISGKNKDIQDLVTIPATILHDGPVVIVSRSRATIDSLKKRPRGVFNKIINPYSQEFISSGSNSATLDLPWLLERPSDAYFLAEKMLDISKKDSQDIDPFLLAAILYSASKYRENMSWVIKKIGTLVSKKKQSWISFIGLIVTFFSSVIFSHISMRDSATNFHTLFSSSLKILIYTTLFIVIIVSTGLLYLFDIPSKISTQIFHIDWLRKYFLTKGELFHSNITRLLTLIEIDSGILLEGYNFKDHDTENYLLNRFKESINSFRKNHEDSAKSLTTVLAPWNSFHTDSCSCLNQGDLSDLLNDPKGTLYIQTENEDTTLQAILFIEYLIYYQHRQYCHGLKETTPLLLVLDDINTALGVQSFFDKTDYIRDLDNLQIMLVIDSLKQLEIRYQGKIDTLLDLFPLKAFMSHAETAELKTIFTHSFLYMQNMYSHNKDVTIRENPIFPQKDISTGLSSQHTIDQTNPRILHPSPLSPLQITGHTKNCLYHEVNTFHDHDGILCYSEKTHTIWKETITADSYDFTIYPNFIITQNEQGYIYVTNICQDIEIFLQGMLLKNALRRNESNKT